MHAVFIAYGDRRNVERFLRELEAEKFILKVEKDGKTFNQYITGTVRLLPLGIYEYIFPKEYMDEILNGIGFDMQYVERMGTFKISFLRKLYGLEKVPEYDKSKKRLFWNEDVKIIPIGIRRDLDNYTDGNGWTHEAL